MPVNPDSVRRIAGTRRQAEQAAAIVRPDRDNLLAEQRSAAYPQIQGIFDRIEDNPQLIGNLGLGTPQNLTPEEALAYERAQQAQNPQPLLSDLNNVDEQVLQQLAVASKADLVERFGRDMRLNEQQILSIISNSADFSLSELRSALSSMNEHFIRQEAIPDWSKLSPREKSARWEGLSEVQKAAFGSVGINPPAEEWTKERALAWLGHAYESTKDRPALGIPFRVMERGEEAVSQFMAGARLENDLGLFDSVETGDSAERNTYISGLSKGLANHPLVTGFLDEETMGETTEKLEDRMPGVFEEFGAQFGALLMGTLGGQASRYWRAGATSTGRDGQFLPNVVDEVAATVDDQATLEMILAVAEFMDGGAVNQILEIEDKEQRDTAMHGIYVQAIEEFLDDSMPGFGEEVAQNRFNVFNQLSQNLDLMDAAADLNARGMISPGRNAAARVGMVPGDEGYSTLSGTADGIKSMIADPFAIGGKARNLVKAARWGVEASDGVARAGRVARMMERSSFENVADDVSRAVREQLELEVNALDRAYDLSRGQNIDISKAYEELENLTTSGVLGRSEGMERLARRHPHLQTMAEAMMRDARVDLWHKINAATATGTTDIVAGTVDRLAILDGVATTRRIDGVELLKRAEDGTLKITEEAVGIDRVKHWVLQRDGLEQIQFGRAGGLMNGYQFMPHEAVLKFGDLRLSLNPAKGLKRASNLAIDWMNDSHVMVGRKLLDGGYITEEAYRGIGLGGVQSGQRLGTTWATQSAINETSGFFSGGTAINAVRAAASVAGAPARVAFSLANLSHNGPIKLGSSDSSILFRNYLSMMPSDVRGRVMAQWYAAATPGAKRRVIESTVREMLDVNGIRETKKGKEFADEIIDRYEKMHGYAPTIDGVSHDMMFDHAGGAHRAALDTNDLSGAVYLPDVRMMYRYASLANGMKAVGSPIDLLFGNEYIDWFHGSIWNRFTLFKPAFAFRAGVDEVGLAMAREGIFQSLVARNSYQAYAGKHARFIPRIIRLDHFALRKKMQWIGNDYTYEAIYRNMLTKNDLPAVRNERQIELLKMLDRHKNGSREVRKQVEDQINRLNDLDRRTLAKLKMDADRWMRNENPVRIFAELRAKSDMNAFQRGYVNLSEATEEIGEKVRNWMSSEAVTADVHRMLSQSGDATRHTHQVQDMQTVVQGMDYQNASNNANEIFNVGGTLKDPTDPRAKLVIDQIQTIYRDSEVGHIDNYDLPHKLALAAEWERKMEGELNQTLVHIAARVTDDVEYGRMTEADFTKVMIEELIHEMKTNPDIAKTLSRFDRHAQTPDGRIVVSAAQINSMRRLKGTPEGDLVNGQRAAGKGDGGMSDGGGMPPMAPHPSVPPDGAGALAFDNDFPAPDDSFDPLSMQGTPLPKQLGGKDDFAYQSIIDDEIAKLDQQIEELEQTIALAPNLPDGPRDVSDQERLRLERLLSIRTAREAAKSDPSRAASHLLSIARLRGLSDEVISQNLVKVLDPRQRDHTFLSMFGHVLNDLDKTIGPELRTELFRGMGLYDSKSLLLDPIEMLRFADDVPPPRKRPKRDAFDQGSEGQSWTELIPNDAMPDDVIELFVRLNVDRLRHAIDTNEAELAGRADLYGADRYGRVQQSLVAMDDDELVGWFQSSFRNYIPMKEFGADGSIDLASKYGGVHLVNQAQGFLHPALVIQDPSFDLTEFFDHSTESLVEDVVLHNLSEQDKFVAMLSARQSRQLSAMWDAMLYDSQTDHGMGAGLSLRRVLKRLNGPIEGTDDPSNGFYPTPLHVQLMLDTFRFMYGPNDATWGETASNLAKKIKGLHGHRVMDHLKKNEGGLFELLRPNTMPTGSLDEVEQTFRRYADELEAIYYEADLTAADWEDGYEYITANLSGEEIDWTLEVELEDLYPLIKGDEKFVQHMQDIGYQHEVRPFEQPVNVTNFVESFDLDLGEESERLLKEALLGKVGSVEADLLRLDVGEIAATLLEVKRNGYLTESEFDVIFQKVSDLAIAKQMRELAEEVKPPQLDIFSAIDEFSDREGLYDFTPEMTDLLVQYMRYMAEEVKTNPKYEMSRQGLGWNVYGSLDGDTLLDEVGDVAGPRPELYGGDPSAALPPPPNEPPIRGNDWDEGAESAWMAENMFASKEEAIALHAEAKVNDWKRAFMADPFGVADEFHLGHVSIPQGKKWVSISVKSDGTVSSAEDLDPALLSSHAAGHRYVEVGKKFDTSQLVGTRFEELTEVDGVSRSFGKPITNAEYQIAERVVMDALASINGSSKRAGFQDPLRDPVSLNEMIAVYRSQGPVARRDIDKVLMDEIHKVTPSIADRKRAVAVLNILLKNDGVDPNAINRVVNGQTIKTFSKRLTEGRPEVVTMDDLNETVIRPAMLPKETYAARLRRETPDTWRESINTSIAGLFERGFTELYLPMIDVLSRNPLITAYYHEGAEFVRKNIREQRIALNKVDDLNVDVLDKNAREAGTIGPSKMKQDAADLEVSEDFDRAGFLSTERDVNEAKQKTLSELAAMGRYREAMKSEALDGIRALPGMQTAVIDGVRLPIGSKWIETFFNDNPKLRQVFDKHLESVLKEGEEITVDVAFQRIIDRAKFIEGVIDGKSKTYAYSKMTAFTDMDSTGSLFSMKFRNLFPFYWAEERFLKRFTQSVYASPERFRMMQLTYKGIDSAGVIEEDEDGNKIFVYPAGRMASNGIAKLLGWMMNRDVESGTLPGVHRVTGQLSMVAPGLDTQGAPQPGPVFSVLMHKMAHLFPELESTRDALLPEISENPNRTAYEFLVPSTMRNFANIPNAEERYAGQMFLAAAALIAAGEAPFDPDNPDAEPTPQQLQVFNDRLEEYTRVFAVENAFYGAIGLAPPRIDIEDTAKNREFREIISRFGWQDGLVEFVRRNPDIDSFTMFSTETSSGGPIAANKHVDRQLEQNREWFTSDIGRDTATHFIDNRSPDGEWFAPAHSKQLAMGLRRRKSEYSGSEQIINNVTDELYFQAAAPMYYEVKTAYEAMREELSGTPMAVDLQAEWEQWQRGYDAAHPLFAEMRLNGPRETPRVHLVKLEQALADPRRPSNHKVELISDMMTNWRYVRNELDQLKTYQSRTGVSPTYEKLRSDFIRWGYEQTANHPDELRYLWENYIIRDLGYGRDDAMETAGIRTLSGILSPTVRN